jgi:hypothetical protein
MADRRCSPKRGGSKSGDDSGVPAAGVYKRELGDGEEAVQCFSRVDFTWTRREAKEERSTAFWRGLLAQMDKAEGEWVASRL